MYCYIDESGDLGFNKLKATKHFIIVVLIVKNQKEVRNCIKRIRQKRLKKKFKKISELKFNKSDEIIRKHVLDCLSRRDIEIYAIVLRKEQVYDKLHDHKNEVYNYITKILLEKIIMPPEDRKILIFVDKFLSKSNRENYNLYIENKLLDLIKTPIEISIEHVDSHQELCIQAADFIAEAIFHKYEFNSDKYFRVIESKIKNIQMLLENKANPSLLAPTLTQGAIILSGGLTRQLFMDFLSI